MPKKLTITALPSKEFDKLPYKYAKQSWGLAVRKTGKAYIRLTDDPAFNRMAAEHELGELVASKSAHEVDGVRYGIFDKVKQWVRRNIQRPLEAIVRPRKYAGTKAGAVGSAAAKMYLGAIPVVGPALATGYGVWQGRQAGRTTGSAIMGGISGYGLGSVGAGTVGAINQFGAGLPYSSLTGEGGMISAAAKGFKAGASGYFGTPIIPGVAQTAPSTWFGAGAAGTTTGGVAPAEGVGTNLATGYPPTGTEIAGSMLPTVEQVYPTTGMPYAMPTSQAATLAAGAGAPGVGAGPGAALPKVGEVYAGGAPGTAGAGAPSIGPVTEAPAKFMGMSPAQIGTLLATGSGLAGGAVEPPEVQYDPEQYIQQAKEFQEKYSLGQLPGYAQQEIQKLVETPISGPQFDMLVDAEVERPMRNLNVRLEQQQAQIDRQFSNANALNTPDHLRAKALVDRAINEEQSLVQLQGKATVTAQVYENKKWALNQLISVDQWDDKVAMDLATIVGRGDELRMALEVDDYEKFQDAMAEIFTFGADMVYQSVMQKGQKATA